ncbi:hypothetical protein TcasGA2_TC005325 [Tribolium castaneum]|uniref:Uncharacterized protein n=1 Tax=Tribolium castaneum TaxID=7070 RepID=D6WV77_TRICA|nr:hypothetical protein TcasGA2_TC005325 [Tribolium castaneum]
MLRPYCAQNSVGTVSIDRSMGEKDASVKMVLDEVTISEKTTAAEAFAEYLHENKGRKLSDEDVKVLLRRAFQGCDLVYGKEGKRRLEEKGDDK